jgi:hypothetical protein
LGKKLILNKHYLFRLYQWSGEAQQRPSQIKTDLLDGLNHEVILPFSAANSDKTRLLILNDNEKSDICARQGFGGVWIEAQ